ncbi:MAG: hypothetical protein JXA33_26990 [Anaerolineae bacterium]|nr:hypothetical protein [Anaerolineae bacterium]
MTISIPLQTLERLTRFYQAGYQTSLVDQALHKILMHQIEQDKADLEQVITRLRCFEEQYLWSSEEFWTQYQAGKLDDSEDFLEWNAFYKMYQRILERLRILQGENTDD